jgi:hypothetical protein
MNKIIIFLSCLLLSCTSALNKNHYKTIEPKIDIQKAKEIAIELIKTKYNENEYMKDSISVHETNLDLNHWEVWIKKSKVIKPPYLIIEIDKLTGKAEDISDKLE